MSPFSRKLEVGRHGSLVCLPGHRDAPANSPQPDATAWAFHDVAKGVELIEHVPLVDCGHLLVQRDALLRCDNAVPPDLDQATGGKSIQGPVQLLYRWNGMIDVVGHAYDPVQRNVSPPLQTEDRQQYPGIARFPIRLE